MPVIINGTPVDTNFACKMLWLDVNPQHPGVSPSDHAASGALKQMKNTVKILAQARLSTVKEVRQYNKLHWSQLTNHG